MVLGGFTAFLIYYFQCKAKRRDAAALIVTQIEELKEKMLQINNISIDNIYSFWGVVQSFKNLKFLNLEFTSDENVLYAYEYIRGKEKDKSFEIIQYIYKIEVIELVLSNMFTQNVIDMLNKVMMFDEIISNSYLEREFIIVFDYDDYISFMDMFATNNGMELTKLDDYIIDYLLLFPKIISNSKPTIRLLTNYSEL